MTSEHFGSLEEIGGIKMLLRGLKVHGNKPFAYGRKPFEGGRKVLVGMV